MLKQNVHLAGIGTPDHVTVFEGLKGSRGGLRCAWAPGWIIRVEEDGVTDQLDLITCRGDAVARRIRCLKFESQGVIRILRHGDGPLAHRCPRRHRRRQAPIPSAQFGVVGHLPQSYMQSVSDVPLHFDSVPALHRIGGDSE